MMMIMQTDMFHSQIIFSDWKKMIEEVNLVKVATIDGTL